MDAKFEIEAIGQKLARGLEQHGHPLPGVEIAEISEDWSAAPSSSLADAGIVGWGCHWE